MSKPINRVMATVHTVDSRNLSAASDIVGGKAGNPNVGRKKERRSPSKPNAMEMDGEGSRSDWDQCIS